MNKQTITACLLSTLVLATTTHAQWQDWAIGGAVAAGVGGIIYWATRPDAPEKVKRNAEEYFTATVMANQELFDAHVRHPNKATEEIILLMSEKGRYYRTTRWFVSDNDYISYDCACHAPIVRGYAALLEESENLLWHHKKLKKCFGSEQAARQEYYNFDNLEVCAHELKEIAGTVAQHSSFMTARDAFHIHRENMRQHAETQRRIAHMHREMRDMHRKKPAAITVNIETKPKMPEPSHSETSHQNLYKYLVESI